MPEKTRDHLRRLDHSHYCGFAIVHWTHSIDQRKTGWLNTEFHTLFREALIHAGCLHGLWCPAYCLMPDHIHLVWSGVEISSDQLAATTWLRRRLNGWLKPGGQRLQKQAYDRVLRESDRDRFAFEKLIAYLFANPVRGGFIADRPKGPGGRGEIPFFPVIPKSHGNDLIPKITGICIGEYIIAHSNAKSSGTRERSYPDDHGHPLGSFAGCLRLSTLRSNSSTTFFARRSGTHERSYPDDQEHPTESSPPLRDNIFQGAT